MIRNRPIIHVILICVSLICISQRNYAIDEEESKEHSLHIISQSHIDAEWLWPRAETKKKCRSTFSKMLNFLQKYPSLAYSQSQAQFYAWMQQEYPEIFEGIKEYVQQGRWEIVGGMWIESDTNLPCGESLVRQILYGKKYYRESFGVDVRVGWLPDTFGFSWMLPQIYKKCGIDYFVTTKLEGKSHNTFWWESPDGSRVLCFFPVQPIGSRLENTSRVTDEIRAFKKNNQVNTSMMLYGLGDGGGGPTEKSIQTAMRLEKTSEKGLIVDGEQIRIKNGTVIEFFEDLEKEDLTKLPVWRNELYLKKHRGTYTTQAKMKERNRRSEIKLLSMEKFGNIAKAYGYTYQKDEIERLWHKMLFNQFHDVLPGSSIREVYVNAYRDFDEIQSCVDAMADEALWNIALQINTEGKEGVPLIVFNPLSWSRDGLVRLSPLRKSVPADIYPFTGEKTFKKSLKTYRHFKLTDERNNPVPWQRVEGQNRNGEIIFIARDIPALGYKVYRMIKTENEEPFPETNLSACDNILENEYFRVVVDKDSGDIASIYDKQNSREVLSSAGNKLQIFTSKPERVDAWNIEEGYERKEHTLPPPLQVTMLESGPVRVVIRVVRAFSQSRFTQDISLYSDLDRVDCRMNIDWQEDQKLLKVAFPLNVDASKAVYEIPYGTIERSTLPCTPEDKAKWEVSGQKWIDLSDGRYGVSLLNDSKYGYDVKGNLLRMTLLTSPLWPDPTADRGIHEFVYSIYSHKGDWRKGRSYQAGYNLNYKLIPVISDSHQGKLPQEQSFIRIEPSYNVVISTVKEAEHNDDIVIRLHELFGKTTDAKLMFFNTPEKAVETNMLEKEIRAIAVEGETLSLTMSPYEIKTLRISF